MGNVEKPNEPSSSTRTPFWKEEGPTAGWLLHGEDGCNPQPTGEEKRLQHHPKGDIRASRKLIARGTSPRLSSWQRPNDWLIATLEQCPGKRRLSDRRQDTSSDCDCCFDQKEECSMIGRGPLASTGPVLSRQRSGGRANHPERKSTRLRGPMHFCPLLPTAMAFVSYGFVLVRVRVRPVL